MWVSSVVGMATKFFEGSLSVMYRRVGKDGVPITAKNTAISAATRNTMGCFFLLYFIDLASFCVSNFFSLYQSSYVFETSIIELYYKFRKNLLKIDKIKKTVRNDADTGKNISDIERP